jgi:type VI secretion system protein ImpI
VSTGVEIRIFDRSANREGLTIVPKLPVRIGRNSLNDLVLAYNFVSQFHATLALQDGRLVLRDLGSTNGVLVANQRVPPNAFVDLSPYHNTFSIVALTLQVTVKHVTRPPSQRLNSTSYAVPKIPEAGVNAPSLPPNDPAETQLRSLYGRYRSAASEMIQAAQWNFHNTPPPHRPAFVQRLERDFPLLAADPEFRAALQLQGVPNLQGPQQVRAQLENLALNGLQEIARSLMPAVGAPEDLVGLATLLDKLKGTLDVFLKSFVQLRDGYRQFEADMALRKRQSSSVGQSRGTSADVAMVLLDWRHSNQDAISGVSATFADIMIHQVALLNGVMNGVKSLMKEMSPAELEGLAQREGGLGLGPLRYRSLWRAYEKRFKDVTEEDKRLFDLVFGETFAVGYEQSIEQR